MADSKISALTSGTTPLTGTEEVVIVQGGVTVKATAQDIGDLGSGGASINVQTVVSAATVTPTFSNDEVTITAQAVGLTLANPTGTATEGKVILIRIKDNATSQTIAYGTEYRALGVTLPTATTISKTHYLGMIYNVTDTKWDVIGVNEEA